MLTLRHFFKLASLIMASAVLFAGCSKYSNTANGRSFKGTPACTNNHFLQQYSCSFDKIQAAAQDGDPDAQYALGYMYYYGIGTARDVNAATLWIRRAAAQNQPLALKATHLLNDKQYPGRGDSTTEAHTSMKYTEHTAAELNHAKPKGSLRSHLPHYSHKVSSNKAALGVTKKPDAAAAQKTINESRASKLHHQTVAQASRVHIPTTNSQYTIQLMSGTSLASLSHFVIAHHLQNKTFYYTAKIKGHTHYKLVYGKFASKDEAIKALQTLPRQVRALHPWVKSFSLIKKEVGVGVKS